MFVGVLWWESVFVGVSLMCGGVRVMCGGVSVMCGGVCVMCGCVSAQKSDLE